MSNSIIQIRKLSKEYGGNYVLKDLSLDVIDGETVCILGPSGSGKSTLLNILAGVTNPSSGTIDYNGHPLLPVAPNKRSFGVVFQGLFLFPHLNVEKNISFSLKSKQHKKDRFFIEHKLCELISLFKLNGLEKRLPDQLSGGEKQRVALARAIAFEPKVLLLDEPFSALDQRLKDELMNELTVLKLKFNLTIIYITHDQSECANLANRVLVLNEGKVQQVGSYEELYTSPQNCFVRSFIGYNNCISGTVTEVTNDFMTVKVNPTLQVIVKRIEGNSIGNSVELYIRPEHIVHIESNLKKFDNKINTNIIRFIKINNLYKIYVQITPDVVWHFYDNDVALYRRNGQANISFHSAHISVYNKA